MNRADTLKNRLEVIEGEIKAAGIAYKEAYALILAHNKTLTRDSIGNMVSDKKSKELSDKWHESSRIQHEVAKKYKKEITAIKSELRKIRIEENKKLKEEKVKKQKAVESFDLYTRYHTFRVNAVFKEHFTSTPTFLEWFLVYRTELLTTTAIHKGNLKDAWHEAHGSSYYILSDLNKEVQNGRYREVIAEMKQVIIKEEWLGSISAETRAEIMKDFEGVSIQNEKVKLSAGAVARMSEPKYSVLREAKKKHQQEQQAA